MTAEQSAIYPRASSCLHVKVHCSLTGSFSSTRSFALRLRGFSRCSSSPAVANYFDFTPNRIVIALLVRGTARSVARSLPCWCEALLASLCSRWDSTQLQHCALLLLCTCHHWALGEDARGGQRPRPGVQLRQHAELPVRRRRILLRPACQDEATDSDKGTRTHDRTLSSALLRSWHLGLGTQQVWDVACQWQGPLTMRYIGRMSSAKLEGRP